MKINAVKTQKNFIIYYAMFLERGGIMAENSSGQSTKRKRYASKSAQAIPVVSAAVAAILTEGKCVEDMEILALFFDSLANNIFLIASMSEKGNNGIIIENLTPFP
jgi:hypothetical protein